MPLFRLPEKPPRIEDQPGQRTALRLAKGGEMVRRSTWIGGEELSLALISAL
jgi:hypothetical protein